MEIDDERAVMLANAIGLAVIEVRTNGLLLTEYTLSEKLEDMRQKETNVIGRGAIGTLRRLSGLAGCRSHDKARSKRAMTQDD